MTWHLLLQWNVAKWWQADWISLPSKGPGKSAARKGIILGPLALYFIWTR